MPPPNNRLPLHPELLADRPDAVRATAPLERLLDLIEAAQFMNMSPSWLWQKAKKGEVKSLKCGRARRFDPADLRAFIEKLKGESCE
jgi:excisionase family DNA binding protein